MRLGRSAPVRKPLALPTPPATPPARAAYCGRCLDRSRGCGAQRRRSGLRARGPEEAVQAPGPEEAVQAPGPEEAVQRGPRRIIGPPPGKRVPPQCDPARPEAKTGQGELTSRNTVLSLVLMPTPSCPSSSASCSQLCSCGDSTAQRAQRACHAGQARRASRRRARRAGRQVGRQLQTPQLCVRKCLGQLSMRGHECPPAENAWA